jgi:antitoxin (DNA-binding transcriptional repressor) of toxin-antitoxin stability system
LQSGHSFLGEHSGAVPVKRRAERRRQELAEGWPIDPRAAAVPARRPGWPDDRVA